MPPPFPLYLLKILVVTWFKDHKIYKSHNKLQYSLSKTRKTKGIIHSTWLPLLSLNQVRTKILLQPLMTHIESQIDASIVHMQVLITDFEMNIILQPTASVFAVVMFCETV